MYVNFCVGSFCFQFLSSAGVLVLCVFHIDELSRSLALVYVFIFFVSLAHNDCFQQWFGLFFTLLFSLYFFVFYKMIDSAVFSSLEWFSIRFYLFDLTLFLFPL